MTDETKLLFEVIESAGLEPRDYSGRGMMGDSCLAIAVDRDSSEMKVVADLIEATSDDEDKDILVKALRGARTDSLGMGSIIYFPRFEYSESAGEEKED